MSDQARITITTFKDFKVDRELGFGSAIDAHLKFLELKKVCSPRVDFPDVSARDEFMEQQYYHDLYGPDTPTHFRRRAQLMLQIPCDDRTMVSLDVNRQVNTIGGRHSDALEQVCREYHHNPERFKQRYYEIRAADHRKQELELTHMRAGTAIGRAMTDQMDKL